MANTVYLFACSDAVCIVGVFDVIELFKLASLFPRQSVTKVLNRVALSVVFNGLAIEAGEKILPSCITIGVRLTVLLGDVTVVIILHRVDNFTVYRLGKKLTKRIVGVERGISYGSTVNRVGLNNGGNSLLGIVAVGEGSTIRENDLADKLSGSRGLNLSIGLVLLRYLTCMVSELSGNKIGAKLELVE